MIHGMLKSKQQFFSFLNVYFLDAKFTKKYFWNLLHRCPKEVYPHVSTIINICLKYLTYDPNYNYDDEEDDENAMDADGADDDDQGTSLNLLSKEWRAIYFSTCIVWFSG